MGRQIIQGRLLGEMALGRVCDRGSAGVRLFILEVSIIKVRLS